MSFSAKEENLGRRLGVSLLLGLLALAIFFSNSATSFFEFNRNAIESGELWRLVTGHWTHFTFQHSLWDATVFVVLGILCTRHSLGRFLAVLVASPLIISGAVWFLEPQLELYRGLSGIDSALFALLGALLLKEAHRKHEWRSIRLVLVFFLLFAAKIAFEGITGGAVFASDLGAGVLAVPVAHVAGFFTGVACALLPDPIRAAIPEFSIKLDF